MNRVVLKIPNMSCKHCVMRIEKAIKSVGADGRADLETKTAVVDFDLGKTRLEEVIKAIQRHGYEVEVV
ncbi:mercury-binding protein (plasmid) [Thermococcus peptonophilus]|uniref:Mercury-binding protein n=2 Tax=Thermococcus peptonophilus TaxID=53952 RepID=A0A142CXV9_9EURY|nr:heavy-metal-associated domain-containing protein [Thermococcus peptonophilus]AMQ19611.1 mercury-binding protein [Thermococcus peptonophilus]